MKRKKKEQKEHWESIFATMDRNYYDPLGSYSGRPVEPQDVPVQDADDL